MTTVDDPQTEFVWNDWLVRHRSDNRSPRPWTVEHMGRRIATFDTADAAKRQALKCIREDYGQQTAIRWKQVSRASEPAPSTPPPSSDPSPRDNGKLDEAGMRLLAALCDFVGELQRGARS